METGIYYRILRDGKPITLEMEYLTPGERREVILDLDHSLGALDRACDLILQMQRDVLDLIHSYGGVDGAHHKQWLLDQIVRQLTQEDYDDWVKQYQDGEDGPNSYKWDIGIAP